MSDPLSDKERDAPLPGKKWSWGRRYFWADGYIAGGLLLVLFVPTLAVVLVPFGVAVALLNWVRHQRSYLDAKENKWPFIIAGGLSLPLYIISAAYVQFYALLLALVPVAIYSFYGKERFRLFALGFLWILVLTPILAPVICGMAILVNHLNSHN